MLDYNDNPLHEGDRVSAWHEGKEFKATVKVIEPAQPQRDYRGVVLVKDDGTESLSFSDAVIVLEPREEEGQ